MLLERNNWVVWENSAICLYPAVRPTRLKMMRHKTLEEVLVIFTKPLQHAPYYSKPTRNSALQAPENDSAGFLVFAEIAQAASNISFKAANKNVINILSMYF